MSDSGPDRDISRTDSEVKEGTFWLARNVLLRYLGFIYFLAFLISLHQNKRLFGKEGFLPNNASAHLGDIINRLANTDREGVINVPKIVYWFFMGNKPDENTLVFITHVGLALSLSLLIRGAANWVLMLCLWTIYHLLVDARRQWHSFGWEFQLLETGFLATFLCPVWSLRQPPTSRAVIRGFKWMFFRIMWAGVSLINSGDVSLFNWLNIVPCLACFDDRSVCWLLPGRLRRQIAYKQELRQTEGLKTFNLCLGFFIALRGIQVLIRLNEDMTLMNELQKNNNE